MTLSRNQVALNAIQWINIKEDPNDPDSASLWLYREPTFRSQYPDVLAQVRASGFDAVMMEVLGVQTLQDYARMIDDAGLRLAPGYCDLPLPEDHGVTLTRGSSEWIQWFDRVRRKAEESNFFGLDTVFLAPEIVFADGFRTASRPGLGDDFKADRLDRVTELLADAAEVLRAEGVRAGLHNHIGTWVETEAEIDHVLGQIDPALLGASFDVGHLVWAGIDPVAMIARYRDRILDLHVKDLDTNLVERYRADPVPYRKAADTGIFLEPGLGGIDLDGVLGALAEDFGGWIIIEVDRASMPPAASADVSWAWVEKTFPV